MYEVLLGFAIIACLLVIALLLFKLSKIKDEYPIIYKNKKRK